MKSMRKSIKVFGIIVFMGIMLIVAYLLGTTQGKTVVESAETIPDRYIDTVSDDFSNNYIDMRNVTDFVVSADGIEIYLSDGNYYYWEK